MEYEREQIGRVLSGGMYKLEFFFSRIFPFFSNLYTRCSSLKSAFLLSQIRAENDELNFSSEISFRIFKGCKYGDVGNFSFLTRHTWNSRREKSYAFFDLYE